MADFNYLYKRDTRLTIDEITKTMHEVNNSQGMDNLIDYARLCGRQVSKIYVLCAYDVQGETYYQLYETDLNGVSRIEQALNGLVSQPSGIPEIIKAMLSVFIASSKRKKRVKTASWVSTDGAESRLVVMAIKGGLSG